MYIQYIYMYMYMYMYMWLYILQQPTHPLWVGELQIGLLQRKAIPFACSVSKHCSNVCSSSLLYTVCGMAPSIRMAKVIIRMSRMSINGNAARIMRWKMMTSGPNERSSAKTRSIPSHIIARLNEYRKRNLCQLRSVPHSTKWRHSKRRK